MRLADPLMPIWLCKQSCLFHHSATEFILPPHTVCECVCVCFFTRDARILFLIMPFSSKPHDLPGTYFSKFPFFFSSSSSAASSSNKWYVVLFIIFLSLAKKQEKEMCTDAHFLIDRDSQSILNHIRGRRSKNARHYSHVLFFASASHISFSFGWLCACSDQLQRSTLLAAANTTEAAATVVVFAFVRFSFSCFYYAKKKFHLNLQRYKERKGTSWKKRAKWERKRYESEMLSVSRQWFAQW